MNIVTVICARDEEKRLGATLLALRNQSMPISFVVLVDDGSLDRTGEIASEMNCIVVSSPRHEKSYTGYRALAGVWNIGLAKAKELNPTHVLLMGADHALPATYVEKLFLKMLIDPKLVVCSGRIEEEPFDVDAPRGSGRLVKAWFWLTVNGMRYPVRFGWETWLIHKAQELGWKAVCFGDVVSNVSRVSTPMNEHLIPNMYALGYPWIYIVGRCLLKLKSHPLKLFTILRGLSELSTVEKMDNAYFIHKVKKREMVRKIKNIITKQPDT